MKHEQSKGHKLNLQKIGETVSEVAMDLEITEATLYRAIKRLNYTPDVFIKDKYVRRVLCVYLSADGAKKAVDAIRQFGILRDKLKAEIETVTQVKDAEINRLQTLLASITLKDVL